jgi:outer membrane immunogenic protein
MKKTLAGIAAIAALIGTPALAADMAVKAAPAPQAVAPSWAGFYLGGDIGGVWGRDVVSPTIADGGTFPRSNTLSSSGLFGGGTLGYNFQSGNIVYGLEGDLGAMGISQSKADPGGGTEIDSIKSGLYGDVTGRLGVVVGPSLLYAKGGYAFYDGRANVTTAVAGFTVTNTSVFNGWTVGGGWEYMFAPAWSAKIEYLHFDFGTQNADLTGVPGKVPYSNKLTADTVKVGINYHFGYAAK